MQILSLSMLQMKDYLISSKYRRTFVENVCERRMIKNFKGYRAVKLFVRQLRASKYFPRIFDISALKFAYCLLLLDFASLLCFFFTKVGDHLEMIIVFVLHIRVSANRATFLVYDFCIHDRVFHVILFQECIGNGYIYRHIKCGQLRVILSV